MREPSAEQARAAPAEPSGPSLVAFFATMYFAALRSTEAATSRKTNLSLPAVGWGELLWRDGAVPSAPELTALLHDRLEAFGTGADGLLFRRVRGGRLAESTYCRIWRRTRRAALT